MRQYYSMLTTTLKRILIVGVVLVILSVAVACRAASPAATPTPESTPTPTVPTPEVQQRPQLPVPDMQGAVDLGGGHDLDYQCYGKGTPTVIVEAGAGDKPTLSMSWNAVILGVSPTTRICIYDRTFASTSQEVAENLHVLVTKVPIPGPYVLVAHSLGGWHARVFAHLYPEDVAGMILVDTTATYPDAAVVYATEYPTYSPGESAGITQNRMSEADITTGEMLPSIDGLDMKTSNEQVRQAGSFGDLPLVVISQNLSPNDFPDLDPAAQKQLAALMLKIQADLATLSSRSTFMVAHTSNHFISLYEPQIIVDAINRMVEEIRDT
jgi:pimeloyl-ACP methyl ester carboxylesterase